MYNFKGNHRAVHRDLGSFEKLTTRLSNAVIDQPSSPIACSRPAAARFATGLAHASLPLTQIHQPHTVSVHMMSAFMIIQLCPKRGGQPPPSHSRSPARRSLALWQTARPQPFSQRALPLLLQPTRSRQSLRRSIQVHMINKMSYIVIRRDDAAGTTCEERGVQTPPPRARFERQLPKQAAGRISKAEEATYVKQCRENFIMQNTFPIADLEPAYHPLEGPKPSGGTALKLAPW